ncbi:hypothetical protein B0T10DRAFT_168683 [Thelonectria olida]|uniref:Uncharacterized protein n=1 Tax=Thelonectria olida TaxID=1576542 RepID=A0A9P8WDD7_9HYPO|nr:hypothetical protein B0T10DRAFT_168683 [Thelonectria olida]
MSLLPRTAYFLTPHVRPSLTAAASCRAALLSPSLNHGTFPSSTLISPSRRGLHVSAIVSETIQSTAFTFSWVHSNLGIPWYLAIPLFAVGVNATVRFPLQYYVAGLREKRKQLSPLIMAWAQRHVINLSKEQSQLPERIKRLRMAGAIEKSRKRIYKTWDVQRWKGFAPLLGIVPFVTISEALRRKCGAPLGWISQSVGLGGAQSTAPNLGSASAMFDPSLVEGGCFWFTDLTSADPYFGLPLICSGILAWNTWGRMSGDHIRALLSLNPPNAVQPVALTRLQTVFGRIMLVVPAFPLLFADLPSAIFLYWAASFGLTSINEALLSQFILSKKPKIVVEDKKAHGLQYLKDRS